MEPDSLVSLSFCSRKSHSVIKTQRRAPFDGRLRVSWANRDVLFHSVKNLTRVLRACYDWHHSYSNKINHVKMNGLYVPVRVHPSDGYLVSCWENETKGMKTITQYVTDLFNIDVSEVWASKESFHLIEWVNRRQKTPLKKVIYMACSIWPSENKKMIYLLRDCTISSEICICSDAPLDFRFSGNFRRIDSLYISYGQWVTIDNLLTMDGIDIVLGFSSLSNSDLNLFLKHWLSGGCPRLKLFCAITDSVDILQVLDGLMHNAVFVEDRRDYTSPFGYNRILSGGYDIQREDGLTATVCKQGNGTLVIAVWPETTHNYN
ncbi:hypothetical protein GCK72_015570 [Caenorhabditis remanei]|uniref:Sdz-33 F-box domain-containing protein n=1 Tax=Caenorhabditis remanei TaxID=31234 RepID=A0A6A5GX27_CAERE|nr:hypothetical protein GCK72_015570 [Caenorhabditis remanei]KAF1759109.1 hypothetical protein GCK72_015570 [Caenorhabditis remanei]